MTNREGYERNKLAREREKAEAETKERLGILLQVYTTTTNHLADANESILLEAIFKCMDLPFNVKAQVPPVSEAKSKLEESILTGD